MAYDSGFASLVSGYDNLIVGNVVTKSETPGSGGTFYYRVRASNCAGTGVSSSTVAISGVTGTVLAVLPFYESFNYSALDAQQGLAAVANPVWTNGSGTGSSTTKFDPRGLIAPPGFAIATNGSAYSAGSSSRSAGIRHVTQTVVDGQSVCYSFIYKMLNPASTNAGTVNYGGVTAFAIASLSYGYPGKLVNGFGAATNGTAVTILISKLGSRVRVV